MATYMYKSIICVADWEKGSLPCTHAQGVKQLVCPSVVVVVVVVGTKIARSRDILTTPSTALFILAQLRMLERAQYR